MSPASIRRTAPRPRARAARRLSTYAPSRASPPRPSTGRTAPCRSLVPTIESVVRRESVGCEPVVAIQAAAVAVKSRAKTAAHACRWPPRRTPGVTGNAAVILCSCRQSALEIGDGLQQTVFEPDLRFPSEDGAGAGDVGPALPGVVDRQRAVDDPARRADERDDGPGDLLDRHLVRIADVHRL